jgi:antimicrobial peptide system SdpB family protein
MLDRPFARLGRLSRPWLAVPTWSSGVGLARATLALGTLGTLLTTDPAVLMSPLSDGTVPPTCRGMGGLGVWCHAPGTLAVGRWISVVVLLAVVSGWRPQITAIPHWYVSWSLIVNATIQDGGDQVAAVLTLLLLPICLTDTRRWHWQPSSPARSTSGLSHIVARVTLLLIQIQVAVLYLHASVAKMGVTEWADGTALYYWLHHPTFGSPPWLRPVTDLVTYSPVGVAMLTWGSIALEFSLAIAIVLAPRARRVLLILGLAFHGSIALAMGLTSFFAAMAGALLLYLLPVGHRVAWLERLSTLIHARLRPRRATPVGPR